MPLTDAQRTALQDASATFINNLAIPFGTAESVNQRARQPDPGSLPVDISVRVEIAPPSTHQHPLLAHTQRKTPERVPVYFHALSDHRLEVGDDAEVADTRVIFFIHGGVNLFGHPTDTSFLQFYIQLLRTVAENTQDGRKCVLVAPSYRLATVSENTFPAGLQDIIAAYDYLLGKGYQAPNITIAGDSAGANYAVVLTYLVLQPDGPSPRGVIAIAPFQAYDYSGEHASTRADQPVSPLFGTMATEYLGDSGVAHTDPLVSGTFVPFTASWPKTLILVGSADPQIAVSRELGMRLRAQDQPVELVEYDDRPHGWWTMPQIFPEDIQDAAQRTAQLVLH